MPNIRYLLLTLLPAAQHGVGDKAIQSELDGPQRPHVERALADAREEGAHALLREHGAHAVESVRVRDSATCGGLVRV